MILTSNQTEEFEAATRPLIKWLNDNAHPHTVVHVSTNRAELFEGVCCRNVDDYIKD
jgi:hypothetical protein